MGLPKGPIGSATSSLVNFEQNTERDKLNFFKNNIDKEVYLEYYYRKYKGKIIGFSNNETELQIQVDNEINPRTFSLKSVKHYRLPEEEAQVRAA